MELGNSSYCDDLGAHFRPHDVIAYSSQGAAITGRDARRAIERLSASLRGAKGPVFVNCADSYHFLVALIAGLVTTGRVVLLPNALATTLVDYQDEYETVVDDLDGEPVARTQNGTVRDCTGECSWDARVPAAAIVTLFTSGSTGASKKVVKAWCQLRNEANDLASLFFRERDCVVLATVPQHHLYGLLFRVLTPLLVKLPFSAATVRAPSELNGYRRFVLVSSPAFLGRLGGVPAITGALAVISSGGPLLATDANVATKVFGRPCHEVFGSTETGGIAFRQATPGARFRPLPGVEVVSDDRNVLRIRSQYLDETNWFRCDDLIERFEDGTFELLGRGDDIVKIEEKRISLSEVARHIAGSSNLVQTVKVITYREARRTRLAALLVAVAGVDESAFPAIIAAAKERLKERLDAILIPKQWKVVRDAALTSLGKLSHETAAQLLFGGHEFRLREDDPFFDGHFDGHHVLPALAQLMLCQRFAPAHECGASRLDLTKARFYRAIRPLDAVNVSWSVDQTRGEAVAQLLHDGEICSRITFRISNTPA